jgi:hypothetical protein
VSRLDTSAASDALEAELIFLSPASFVTKLAGFEPDNKWDSRSRFYCGALYCGALHCVALHFVVLHFVVLHFNDRHTVNHRRTVGCSVCRRLLALSVRVSAAGMDPVAMGENLTPNRCLLAGMLVPDLRPAIARSPQGELGLLDAFVRIP